MAVLLITLYVPVMAFCQSARSKVDQSTHLLVQTICEHFRHNRLMRQKIFNSNESRTKCRLNFNRGYWQLLRSVSKFFTYDVGYVDFYGSIKHIDSNYIYDIAPTCMI